MYFQSTQLLCQSVTITIYVQARCWHTCITRSVELTEVHRQRDKQFIALLQNVRIGRCPQAVSDLLVSTQSQDIEREGLRATKLCTHKEDVEAINSRELQALGGTEQRFVAQDSNPQMTRTLDTMCPVGQVITLKVGAQVIILIKCLLIRNAEVRPTSSSNLSHDEQNSSLSSNLSYT